MRTSAQPMGEGLGVSLPLPVIEQQGLKPGTEFEVTVTQEGIVLRPVAPARTRLEELVSQITDENMHELVDWGPPVGREVW